MLQSLFITPLNAIAPPNTDIKPNVEDMCINKDLFSGNFLTNNPAKTIGSPTNEGINDVKLDISVRRYTTIPHKTIIDPISSEMRGTDIP